MADRVVFVEQSPEMPHAGLEVGLVIEEGFDGGDTIVGPGLRHDLHEADCPGGGHRMRVVRGLGHDDGMD
jgi:hypothetical protein